jgi:hypothetical protein
VSLLAVMACIGITSPSAGQVWTGLVSPGRASVVNEGSQFTLRNEVVAATWQILGNRVDLTHLSGVGAENLIGSRFSHFNPFVIHIDGKAVGADSAGVSRLGGPTARPLAADPDATRLADRSRGQEVAVPYRYSAGDKTLDIQWVATLRDGSTYVRQRIDITATAGTWDIDNVSVTDFTAAAGELAGTLPSNPFVSGNVFVGQEHPMAEHRGASRHHRYTTSRQAPLTQGQSMTSSMAIGFGPDTRQLRRAFAYYLNRERVTPYRQFLHYNSWYDIAHPGRPTRFDETEALDRIQRFGQELKSERGLRLESYIFDDPWDNVSGTATDVWQFDPVRHPNQWQKMKRAARAQGAALGSWMSPQGGYGDFRKTRLATVAANTLPYDTSAGVFTLSDPAYLARYREVTLDFVTNQGVNYFKFDGFASGRDAEREALIALIDELRSVEPALFINTTVGSWATPYFLMISDSIWRGGEDLGQAGTGSERQRWITYRDDVTHDTFVGGSTLFPIHSLMLHGLVVAPYAHIPGLRTATVDEFKQDARALFAMGVNLQELYIAPNHPDTGAPIMTEELWDVLAEAARWARANERLFGDMHWVGGDPGSGHVYGTAAWMPDAAMLMLRNPRDVPQQIVVDVGDAFELPPGATTRYRLASPWMEDADLPSMDLVAGVGHTFTLAPYEVRVLDASPLAHSGVRAGTDNATSR